MAQPLLRSSAVFRRAIEACAEAVRPVGLDLLAEFEAEGGWSQPALAMVGLVAVQACCLASGSTLLKMHPGVLGGSGLGVSCIFVDLHQLCFVPGHQDASSPCSCMHCHEKLQIGMHETIR